MKRYFLFSLLALAACQNHSDSADKSKLSTNIVNNPHTAGGMDTVSAANKPTLEFRDTVHEFGTIHQDEVVTHEFAFTNNGKTPLLITSAAASCGCTVADYPHDPVQPGKGGIMKVSFNSAGKSGHQEKSITIHTNTVRSLHMLYIKGEVIAPKNSDKLPTE